MPYRLFFSFVVAFITSISSYASEQAPDRLVVNGDTTLLHALPLGKWMQQNDWKEPLFPDSLLQINTGFWRGYVAYWELIDDRLYLTNIYNGDRSAKVDLERLFPGKVYNGRVHADWFSDTVTAYTGKLLYHMHIGFSAIYENEFEYIIEKGVLINSLYFDNSLSRNTPLMMREVRITSTSDKLINWTALPPIKNFIRVSVAVEVDKMGRADSIINIHGQSEIFNQEALRVVRLLTNLPVIYKRGEQLREPIIVPILFTQKKQEQALALVKKE